MLMLLTNSRLVGVLPLVGDVSEADYECSLIPFEIGGFITKPNNTRLMRLLCI